MACAHSCVGRIRYVGVLLYDAEKVEQALLKADVELVEAQRAVILDPLDPAVREAAGKNGVSVQWLEAAVKSPVHALVKEFGLALPLHPEFRTLPMAYYIPSLSPVLSTLGDTHELMEHGLFPEAESLRAPLSYLASLLAGGNRKIVAAALAKLVALRAFMRARSLDQPVDAGVLERAGLTEDAAVRLYRLLAIGGYGERYVIPAQQREEQDPHVRKGASGFGILKKAGRGK
jgi:nitrate reductase beta subunit